MRRVGLIGGVSPESTVYYYQVMNQRVREHRGGDHSMPLMVDAMDFGVMVGWYTEENWDPFIRNVVEAAQRLKAAGCSAIAIASNTTQMAVEAVREETGLMVIHLMDPLAKALRNANFQKPLLLGTPVVMEGAFYRSTLQREFGIETIIPDAADREIVDRIIFDELCHGRIEETSRDAYRKIAERGESLGADSVILGCTEIGLLIKDGDMPLPIFDTSLLHATALADYALAIDGDNLRD
ncbi:MAG: amino acid racemase [Pseudomonadota bacterium]